MDIDGLLEGHFSEELSLEEERALREALRRSPEHRRRYDERAELLRRLAKEDPPRRERAALWATIEASLDDAEAESPAPSRSTTRGWFSWASALAAAILVLGMVFLVLRHEPPRDDRTFKGGGGPRAAALGRVALELYAIRQGADGHFATPRRIAAGGRMTLQDYIQFRYSSADAAFHHLYLGAIRARQGASAIADEMRLYYPRPTHDAPLAIEKSASMRTVGRSIRLGAYHQAGTLVVVAIFTEKVQPRALVEEALRRLAQGAKDPLATCLGKVAFVRQRYVLTGGPSSREGESPRKGEGAPGSDDDVSKDRGELSK